ncbi:MAG: PHP domain-containing protein, partial [Bacteroidota bacterium]
MILANHHAHTNFSDGRGGPEDYISEALRQGLVAYGFSDHAPIPHNRIGIMTNAELEKYGTF